MYLSIRLKFERLGPARYIGHLDLLRYFQKAVMRADLPVRYSEGFHPHQIMSFAYPLGVSMETLGDYADIDLVEEDGFAFANRQEQEAYEEAVAAKLNRVMHEGITIRKASVIPDGESNSMASVYAADYEVVLKNPAADAAHPADMCMTQQLLEEFMAQDTITTIKEGKKGNRTIVDIKPGILGLRLLENGALFLRLRSGSECNIKPSTVIELIGTFRGADYSPRLVRRLEIYRNTQGGLRPLGDF